jgi:thymidylate synthase
MQKSREPYPLPFVEINQDKKDIFDFDYEDFTLHNYQAHPHIKGKISV